MKSIKIIMACGVIYLILLMLSCKKFLVMNTPIDQINTEKVYSNDETANSALRGIYAQMMSPAGFASGNVTSVTFFAGRSADDFINIGNTALYTQFSDNNVTPLNAELRLGLWQNAYQVIYYTNAALENLEKSNKVSALLKRHLSGEAKFIRAFCNFYLSNLFGEVPIVLSTDYRINASAFASTKEQAYVQIVKDLTDAKDLLDESYLVSERFRANKYAAVALLARVYLYHQDWAKAEDEASIVINKTDQYRIVDDLDQVFLKDSREAILQFAVSSIFSQNTWEGAGFIISADDAEQGNQVALSEDLLKAFEPGDRRFVNWVGTFSNGTTVFKYPLKYKIKLGNSIHTEDSMVLRLAEQYLIRAEARIQQNKLTEGIADLNVLRSRARALPTMDTPNPLPAISTVLNKGEALLAVERERRIELFSEWGHRWLDLKRTNRADVILSPIKGTNWQSTDALYPIPNIEILNDPNLKQNPGYQ